MITEKELVEKVNKYEKLTARGLKEIKIKKELSEKEMAIAENFLSMAKNYYADALYFKEQKNLLTSLAAFSYAHAWLDAGVRAKVFDATDDQLFTLP
ncbi:MAG: DUF357 domain-containing protein [archaeon]|jgi:hypothetical protein